jgi:acetolactate synthase-1/2/3 large subunit
VEVDDLPHVRVPAKAGTSRPKTVSRQIAEAIKRHGVQYIIGQSIPSAVTLAAVELGITQILARTEKDGAIIGDGFARITNTIPVVTSCSGPGTALLACGLGEAFYSSVPLVALIQDIPAAYTDRNAAQEFDDLAMLQAVTKHARRVTQADRIVDYIDRAFLIAGSGRPGPVALLIPPEVLAAAAVEPEFSRVSSYGHYPLDLVQPAEPALADAVNAIRVAERPVVIAGGGVLRSQAKAELRAFVDATGFPVGTTTMGRGAIEDEHPLSLGPLTYAIGNRSLGKHSRPILDEADLVILVGTRTNQNGTHSWKLYPRNARFIHIDIDPQEIGRTYEALRLVGDAKYTLQALINRLAGKAIAASNSGTATAARIRRARDEHTREVVPVVNSTKVPLRPERVLAALNEIAPDGTVMVADASYASTWVTNYVSAKKGRSRFVTPRGQAGIGWGFPLALGAKLGAPKDYTVYFGGDGAFGYTWSELETAIRHGMTKLVAIVLNNSVFGYQKDAEDVAIGQHTKALHMAPVDHAAIARACGWEAIRVTGPDEIVPALKTAFSTEGPIFIEIISDPMAYPPLITFDNKLPDTVE